MAKVKPSRKLHRPTKVRTTKIQTKRRGKVSIPVVVSHPPFPQEPPRRQVSSAVLRAFEQAVKAFNRRQYAEAKPMFENLQTRFPNEVEIIARAQTYIQVCNQKLAHASSTPRNADELYDRGVFALNIGDFTQARTFFEKALRLRPDEPYLLYSLAATHAQTGAHDQALDYLNRSIQIQPRFRSQALNDMDFSGLRENKRFLQLLGLVSPFERFEMRR
jgi:tetratricopeptide (TPR) repeat protein